VSLTRNAKNVGQKKLAHSLAILLHFRHNIRTVLLTTFCILIIPEILPLIRY